MKVIGITGSSGSGKTTVSTIIKNNTGCRIISADAIARDLNVPGEKYYDETLELLGTDILKEDKKVDRKKMATILFSDEELREKMNAITSKYVGGEIKKRIQTVRKKNVDELLVIDAPLLFECGLENVCDYIIAVVCKEDTLKIQRICHRDRLRTNQAKSRLEAQHDDEYYTSRANYIVDNSRETSYEHLIKRVIKIIHEIKGDKEKK